MLGLRRRHKTLRWTGKERADRGRVDNGSADKERADRGSASVEFVILAIPLFLPILIYITQFADVSAKEINSRNLVREVVRAYVTSEDLGQAESRANTTLQYGAKRMGFSEEEISSMKLSITCSAHRCLEEGERVTAHLEVTSPQTHRTIEVSAQMYVSPWQ